MEMCLRNRKKISSLRFFSNKKTPKRKEQLVVRARSLKEFISKHKVRSRSSYGKAYGRKILLLKISKTSYDFFVGLVIFLKNISWKTVAIAIFAVVIYGVIPGALSAPHSILVTTNEHWNKGALTNVTTNNVDDTLQLNPDGNWTARVWASPEDVIAYGHTSASVGSDLYIFRGYSDKNFWKYDTIDNKWTTLADLPQPAYYGADMIYDGNGNIYAIFGNYSLKFYKYSVASNSWSKLPDLLDTPWTGSALSTDGNNIYVMRGNNSTDFWKYEIATEEWGNLAPAPAAVGGGADLINGQDGYLYLTRGNSSVNFYRYDYLNNTWDLSRASITAGYTLAGENHGTFWTDGTNRYIYYLRSNGTATYLRYNMNTNSWLVMDSVSLAAPMTTNYSSLITNSYDNKIYAFRANGTTDLWKFDPATGANGDWVGPKQVMNGTIAINTGADLIWNKQTGATNYIYAARGSSNGFYRYDVSANDWVVKANIPASISTDSKGIYCNGAVYRLSATTNTIFYRYTEDAWTTVQPILANASNGAALACASDNSIYAIRGGGFQNFYKYTSVGGWTALPDMIVNGMTYYANIGGRIVSDGTDMFVMPGDGETAFLKYSVGTGSWTKKMPTPFAQYYGADMTYANNKIYAIAGYYKDETWEYTIASNTWRRLPSNQKIQYGRGPYSGASITYAGGNSFFATPGQGLTDMWSFTSSTNNYITSGEYVSETMDLADVESWVSFNASEDKPTNTNLQYQTRSSLDGNDWSGWSVISGTSINSAPARYLQVKIVLSSSDGISTPSVNDYSISFNSEDGPPTNPLSINGKTHQIGGDALVSGENYQSEHPFFSWSGASDVGSGVAGYYVYFGTDMDADPTIVGNYQTDFNYTVNSSLETGTYYLKIKTKDNNGNISVASWNAFTYGYTGVSPSLIKSVTTSFDFNKGVFDKVSSTGVLDSLRLSSVNGFWNQSRLSLLPGSLYIGGDMVLSTCKGNSNHCLYVLRGGNTVNFYRYEVETDIWSSMTSAPETVYQGGSISSGPNGFLYASRGNGQTTFWSYDIANNVWNTTPSAAPKVFDYGSVLVYDSSRYVYALTGNDDAFYRYDTQNNSWTQKANANFGNPNPSDGQRVNRGTDAAYDGRNNIYFTQGGYYAYFAKYSIKDDLANNEFANTWTILAAAPVGFYDGGSLFYDQGQGKIYGLAGNSRQKFFEYDPKINSWANLPDAPVTISYGASIAGYNNNLYIIRGGNLTNFYRYSLNDKTWELPQRGLFGADTLTGTSYFNYGQGTSMASDNNDNIYIARGIYDNTFGKYNTSTGTFTNLAKLPVGAYDGANFVYNGTENAVYFVPGALRTVGSGAKNNYFFKYSIANNKWTEITADKPPLQTNYGSSMAYDGSQYIYLTRGGASATWWRYDTKGVEGFRWSAALPVMAGWTQGYGSKIVYNDGYIYALKGQGTNSFFRYNVGSSTWSQITDNLPATVNTGADLINGRDGYLYATRGTNTSSYYRYPMTGGSWENVIDIPATVSTGGMSVYNNNKNWVIPGAGANTYQDGLYSYVVGSGGNATGFEKSGSYVSEVMDLISVYHWANLTVNYTMPQNTFLTFETRTSSDGTLWSSWSQTSGDMANGNSHILGITSQPDKFIQLRINFSSSDQIYSPRVDDFAINYYQDIEAPSNPSIAKAYSSNLKTTELIAGSWYNNPSPYFQWPLSGQAGGAIDNAGGSGIDGYYVYFGTDANGEPLNFQKENSFSPSAMVSGQTYYLRILTKDSAGMIPATSFSAFAYKFDNIAPTNTSDISVTPAGFTSKDEYAFLWNPDMFDASSGIAKLQYRTDYDAANAWIDMDNPSSFSLSLPNADHITGAYQIGKNKFYLRAIDGAGNISTPIEQAYYFNSSAPSPPRNLAVTAQYPTTDAVTSNINAFSFTWDQPDSFVGEASKIKYYYSVNIFPTENNAVLTSLTSAGPGPFATQKGINRFFVVAADEAGNIDYSLYAEVVFNADTANPEVPGNIQIFDTSDRENAEYSIAIKWTKPVNFDQANFDGYVIYRSPDGVSEFTEVAKTTGSAYVDTNLESKEYFYYVKTKDKTNNYSIASTIVSIIPTGRFTKPPKMVGNPTFSTQAFQATFDWVTDRIASSFVEYGKTISLGQTTGQVDSLTQHQVIAKGLEAGTKYFYSVKYIDPDGNIGTSTVDTFTTLPPPVISDVLVTDIKLDTAFVNWKTNAGATCTLKYGSGASTNEIIEDAEATNHVQKIDTLVAATTYKIQVSCVDKDLNTFSSDEYTFNTPEEPRIENITIENMENVNVPTIAITYTTNVPITTMAYFKAANEGSPHTYLVSDRAVEHAITLENLNPAQEYVLSIVGTDENGIEAKAMEQRITTKSDSRAPEILTNRAIGRVLSRGKNAQASVYVRVETDEPARIKVWYAKGIVTKSFEQTVSDDALNTYHLITIPGEAGQIYSYQLEVTDDSGNIKNSDAVTVPIEQSKANATEVIMGTFASRFGWISQIGK